MSTCTRDTGRVGLHTIPAADAATLAGLLHRARDALERQHGLRPRVLCGYAGGAVALRDDRQGAGRRGGVRGRDGVEPEVPNGGRRGLPPARPGRRVAECKTGWNTPPQKQGPVVRNVAPDDEGEQGHGPATGPDTEPDKRGAGANAPPQRYDVPGPADAPHPTTEEADRARTLT